MPDIPRLKGRILETFSRVVEREPFRSMAHRQLVEAFELEAVLDLPEEARRQIDETPYPVAARKSHDWTDAEYEPPAPNGHCESARTLQSAYERGETTPLEVFEVIADAIESNAYGELVHSPFVHLDLERAREAAEASTERWRDDAPNGPLDGIPVPIKDHHDMRGLSTECGTSFLQRVEGRKGRDSEPVERLREAGSLLYAKTRMTEWGMQPTGFNATQPMPRNPYDRERAAGGSSTGTATAVALGLAPVGLGSDGGGSIRIPAALCGLFGLKPTFQRLSRRGDLFFDSVTHSGPIGQSTTDLVDFLAVAGADPDPSDPATRPPEWAPTGEELAAEWRRALGRGVEGCRIGIWEWAFETADSKIAEPCWSALRVLEREGADLIEIDLPYADYHRLVGSVILGVEARSKLDDLLERHIDETGDDVRLMMNVLSELHALEFMKCRQTRARLRQTMIDALSRVDLVAAPSTNALAPEYPLGDDYKAIFDEAAIRDLTQYSMLANLCGLPAGSLPVGLSDGLPVGLQFIGDARDEASVLAAMAHCERIGLTGLPRPSQFFSHAS